MFQHIIHHFNFTWQFPDPSQLMPTSYNFSLVLVSYFIALIAGYTGFSLSQLVIEKKAHQVPSQYLIILGSLIMGIGIWSMHFIAMLAYSIGTPINYDAVVTLISVLPAIVASYVTLKAITELQFTTKRKITYGLIIGLGIAAMHYVGMAAMYHAANSIYQIGLFIVSIVSAWALGIVTLQIRFSVFLQKLRSPRWLMWFSAALWATAVCTMHYTGMYAVFFLQNEGLTLAKGISSELLVWPVSVISILLILTTLGFISIQKRLFLAKNEASRNRELLLEAFGEMNEGFLLSDDSGNIVMINQKFYDIFPEMKDVSISKASILFSWIIKSQIHNSTTPQDKNRLSNSLSLHSIAFPPIEFQLKDEHWLQIRQSLSSSGSRMFIFSDITEKKFTDELLLEESKMYLMSRMVSGVAHEVNTPLGICITLSSHFEDETKALTKSYEDHQVSRNQFAIYLTKMNDIANLLVTNTRRAATLINSFKEVAVDQTILSLETIKLKSYTNKILEALKPEYTQLNPIIIVECDDDFELETLPGAYSQIIMNLVKNSIIHAFEGISQPTITIEVKISENHIQLIYRDNGVGMDKTTIDRIFEPFYTTKRQKGGTGLGMHLVFNLVSQKLKGKIKVTSQPNDGSIFYLTLPLSMRELNTTAK